MTYLYKIAAYCHGQTTALAKLGTAAGAIEYAPRSGDQDTLADYLSQMAWLEADSTPNVTGEESSLALPNFPKAAGMQDGGYSEGSNGEYEVGSMDAMQVSPIQNHYLRSAIEEAFAANEDIDHSYGPESAMTQPHGGVKAAASLGGMGSLGGAGPMTTAGLGGGLKGIGGTRTAKGMMSLSAVPKPNQTASMQALKNPVQGTLQQQLGVGNAMANMSNSFGFNHRRVTGNPL